MRNIDHIVQLLKSYLEGKIDPVSHRELNELFDGYPGLRDFIKEIEHEEGLRAAIKTYEAVYEKQSLLNEDRMLKRILAKIEKQQPTKRLHLPRWSYAAAASLVFLFLAGAWIFYNHTKESTKSPMELASALSPGTNKAVLIMPDGNTIELSSQQQGIIMGNDVAYSDGSLLLDKGTASTSLDRLTLATPRGGQYHIELSDGTKVWLNAGSKLHYPQLFPLNHRTVELEGEAYFEVVKDKQKPFFVKTANETVEVLGTHFNVSAYNDDVASSVALIEGKVKVSLPNQRSKVINPGQQTVVTGQRIQIHRVDVEECIAWKNGEFMFNNESLESVMRKLARWYDIDVELSADLSDIYLWGSVSRYDNFDQVLRIIKMTDENIQFKIAGRRVIFMK